jgi:hypothetical protein
LIETAVVPDLVPHPASPLAVALACFNRGDGRWQPDAAVAAGEYFIEPTREPDGTLRVSVMEYSDFGNWSSLRSAWSPFDALQADGRVVPVDEHFLGLRLWQLAAEPQAV